MDAVHAGSSYHCRRTMSLGKPNLLSLLEEDVIFTIWIVSKSVFYSEGRHHFYTPKLFTL